jgi:glutamate-5-semialdehyde dehydrogenase
MKKIKDKAEEARHASILLPAVKSRDKDQTILAIAQALDIERQKIKNENEKDLAEAKKQKISEVMIKRLIFDDAKVDELIKGLHELAEMADPVNQTLKATELDKGLELYCVSCPIGVIGVVFEARPDALVQISCLCLKSGNSVILKGGKEAKYTNEALFSLIKRVSQENGMPFGWIQLIETREDVKKMLALDNYIDLVIPRGSNAFVKHVMDNTNIPVLGHADGICHIYVHEDADIDLAVSVCYDAKVQYPAVCNAMETLLIHKNIASKFLAGFKEVMDTAGVKLLGDDETLRILSIEHTKDKDWSTEYNDLVLSIKIVKGIDEAIQHINKYGSRHTDAIITKSEIKAQKFLNFVDSADVFWNCSTRFADGYRYGLGAEVGISTSKLHARGPVGVEGLVTYKWKMIGNGNIVADYSGEEPKKKFTHKALDKEFPLK